MSRKLVNQEIVRQVRAVYSSDNVCLVSRQRFQFLEDGPVVLFCVKATFLASWRVYDYCVIPAEVFDFAPRTEEVVGHLLDGSRILTVQSMVARPPINTRFAHIYIDDLSCT